MLLTGNSYTPFCQILQVEFSNMDFLEAILDVLFEFLEI